MDAEHEEVEEIPWSQLLAEHRASRPWLAYLAAGVVAAVALGAVAARTLWQPAPPDVIAVTPPQTTGAAPTTTLALPAVDQPVPPGLYSEADLMAALPDAAAARAAVRAEWFVTDYFTLDGDPARTADLVRALWEEPPAPPADPPVRTVVEWARAFRVEASGPDRYRVAVAYRSVVGDETGWRRTPVGAVEILVAAGPDGATAVVDLPSPADLPPALARPEVLQELEAVPPEQVVAAGLEAGGTWGEEPRLVGARWLDGTWRLVVETSDPTGLRWPLVVRVPDAGEISGPAP